jgi:hypothetical protein
VRALHAEYEKIRFERLGPYEAETRLRATWAGAGDWAPGSIAKHLKTKFTGDFVED